MPRLCGVALEGRGGGRCCLSDWTVCPDINEQPAATAAASQGRIWLPLVVGDRFAQRPEMVKYCNLALQEP